MADGVQWLIGAALAGALSAGAASADEHLVVVELFTSQGCSSCPPADDLLTRLAARDDVLPLSLHVDYWDYIGWKDSFADPAHTARQKAYAYASGNHTIYTPQMIVGGLDQIVGNRGMELAELIDRHGDQPARVRLTVARASAELTIRAEALGPLDGPVLVQLVRFLPEERVEIRSGENAGRTITYTNVVTDWREIGRWSGEAPLDVTAEAPGDAPAAVILQKEGPGAILASAVAR